MHMYEGLKHATWECKYHVPFLPKCQYKRLDAQLRWGLGAVFRDLAEQVKRKVDLGYDRAVLSALSSMVAKPGAARIHGAAVHSVP